MILGNESRRRRQGAAKPPRAELRPRSPSVDVEGAKRYVLAGTDDAVVERNGSTLLSLAINCAKPEFCEWLLTDVHVDAAYTARALVSAPDQFGMTPLMKAAEK